MAPSHCSAPTPAIDLPCKLCLNHELKPVLHAYLLRTNAARCRRYLEMQAAYFQSYLCPASSPLAATALETAPLADAALVGISQTGPYVVLDASTAATAAAASAAGGGGGGDGGGVDAAALLQGFGCERMQSFILLDIKWSLQAQVGRRPLRQPDSNLHLFVLSCP